MKHGGMSVGDLRSCAGDVVSDLAKRGDPLCGDDWSMYQVASAFLAEHPDDEDTPIDFPFMESEGWYYLDCGVWGYKTAEGFTENGEGEHWYVGLQLNTASQSLQIIADRDRESVELAVPCKTRGDIRRIHAVFGRRVAR